MTISLVVTRLRAAGCVFAEEEAELLQRAAGSAADLDAMVERRVAGLPLEQVVGWAEFCGQRIVVDPGVFVPRRRTEFLVEQAAALAPPAAVVVDLCCGSGALGVALTATADVAELHAADIDPVEVRCAMSNVVPVGGQVHLGDLFTALPVALRGRIDVLLCNVPYVPSDEVAMLPPEARLHEPRVALDGGADGLDVLRRVAVDAPAWLAPGGVLLVETSERQAASAVAAFTSCGMDAHVVTHDDLGATVVIGSVTRSGPDWSR